MKIDVEFYHCENKPAYVLRINRGPEYHKFEIGYDESEAFFDSLIKKTIEIRPKKPPSELGRILGFLRWVAK